MKFLFASSMNRFLQVYLVAEAVRILIYY